MKMNSILLEALVELDDWLIKNKLYLSLDIIGGIALQLHNVDISRATMDIDLANDIPNSDITHQMKEIGRGLGLGDTWIETPGIQLPKGSVFVSHPVFSGFTNINARILDLDSLILTKIGSFCDRGHITTTDVDDIEFVINSGGNFNEEVLEKGIDFIRQTRSANEEKIRKIRARLSALL